ncbi:hypothetical protein AAFF_G00022720 [Aldrovandia affinis]|uniref:Uncharacterized protein n=1 Tax=Aldrovandia affinis TaxID=143900 RepID=A0AAD7X0C0_9TELE|nr:hypothetical protein AAFF_G00022720 [Aldrovandia affinis]
MAERCLGGTKSNSKRRRQPEPCREALRLGGPRQETRAPRGRARPRSTGGCGAGESTITTEHRSNKIKLMGLERASPSCRSLCDTRLSALTQLSAAASAARASAGELGLAPVAV